MRQVWFEQDATERVQHLHEEARHAALLRQLPRSGPALQWKEVRVTLHLPVLRRSVGLPPKN